MTNIARTEAPADTPAPTVPSGASPRLPATPSLTTRTGTTNDTGSTTNRAKNGTTAQRPASDAASKPATTPASTPQPAVHSMTGYAHRSAETPLGRLDLEIRAVNSRFTDLHFRLGDDCRPLEPRLRAAITSRVRRGKVECRMSLHPLGSEGDARIDTARLAQLVGLVRQVQEVVPGARPPAVSEYLRWLQNPEASPTGASAGPQPPDDETLWQYAAPLVDDCLADFQASRAREGAQLAALLREQAARMAELASRLRPHLPALHAAAETRLFERLNRAVDRLSLNIPPEETLARVRQEISLLSLKDDITEELDRLDTHLEAMDKALAAGGPVGKRLDFLSQELNREANTIASKSIALSITDTALALKLHIEQVREQVQNLE